MTFRYKQTQIHYSSSGAGEPLILLHGFLENKSMWELWIQKLSSTYSVFAIDLPGHGDTEPWGYIHKMEDYASMLLAFAKFQKLESFRLIGHSMGGYVALALAEMAPHRIKKLIMLNSSSLSDSEAKKIDRNRAISMVQKYPNAFVSMAVKHLFLPTLQEELSSEIETVILEAKRCPQQGIINTLKGMRDRKDRSAFLEPIASKCFLVLGQEDKIIPFEKTKQTAEEACVRVKVLSGGHMLHLEQPETVLKASMMFLKN